MQRRNFFRIDYPPADRPSLHVSGRTYEIANLSEQGLEYVHPGAGQPSVGAPLNGEVSFADGERVEVAGSVVRRDGQAVAVRLARGITFQRMQAEQRRLIAKTRPRDDDGL